MVDLRFETPQEEQEWYDRQYDPTPERLEEERSRYFRPVNYEERYGTDTRIDELPPWAIRQQLIQTSQTAEWKQRMRQREAERIKSALSHIPTDFGRTVGHGVAQGLSEFASNVGEVAGTFTPDAVEGVIAADLPRGMQEQGDLLHERGKAFDPALKQMAESGDAIETEWLRTTVQGIARSLTHMGLAAPSGAGGMIGEAAISEMVQTRRLAEEVGLPPEDVNRVAINAGLIEGGITAIFQKTGMGGAESLMSGTKKGILKSMLAEMTEENIIAGLQAVNLAANDVDPKALSKDRLVRAFRDASLQSAGMVGSIGTVRKAGEVGSIAAEELAGLGFMDPSLRKLAEYKDRPTVSRKEYIEATGVKPRDVPPAAERKRQAELAAAALQQRQQQPVVESAGERQARRKMEREAVRREMEEELREEARQIREKYGDVRQQFPDDAKPILERLPPRLLDESPILKVKVRKLEDPDQEGEGAYYDHRTKTLFILDQGSPDFEYDLVNEITAAWAWHNLGDENFRRWREESGKIPADLHGGVGGGFSNVDDFAGSVARWIVDDNREARQTTEKYLRGESEGPTTVEKPKPYAGGMTPEQEARKAELQGMQERGEVEGPMAAGRPEVQKPVKFRKPLNEPTRQYTFRGRPIDTMTDQDLPEGVRQDDLRHIASSFAMRGDFSGARDPMLDAAERNAREFEEEWGPEPPAMTSMTGDRTVAQQMREWQSRRDWLKSLKPEDFETGVTESVKMPEQFQLSHEAEPPPKPKPENVQTEERMPGDEPGAGGGFAQKGGLSGLEDVPFEPRRSMGAAAAFGEAWGVGRPELANPGETETQRETVDELDELRKLKGVPERKPDEDTMAEADAISDQDAVKALRERQQLTDAQTVAARRALREQLDKGLKGEEFRETVEMFDLWRNSGTEQARAFRQRVDTEETPEQRNLRILGESIFTPPKKLRRQLEAAHRKGDQAEIDRLNEEWAKRLENLRKKLKAMGIEMDSLREIAGDQTATAKALNIIFAAKADAWDKAYEFWRNAILWGFQTHAVNTLGNIANTTWSMTAKRFAEAAVNSIARDPKSAQWGEFKHVLRGVLASRSRAARNFLVAWQTERSQFEVDIGKRQDPEGGVPVHEAGDVAIAGGWGKFVRTPQRLLLAADDYIKTIIAHGEVEAQAYRIAKSEGKEGDALAERMEELTLNLDSEAWHTAVEIAHELTFQSKPGPLQKALLGARKNVSGLRYIFPFVTTPANIFKSGIKMSPLGSAQPVINKARTGEWGITPAFLAEQAIAWAIMYAIMGNDPDDPWITGAEAETDYDKLGLARRSYPPLSIRLGDKWISYSRVEPFATAVGLTVDWANSFKKGRPDEPVTSPVKSLMAQAQNKTFLTGIADVVEAFKKPETALPRWASNFTTSWVPNVFRSAGRESDETYMERRIWGKGAEWRRNLLKRTVQKTELGLIDDVPKVDLWGREVARSHPRGDFLWQIVVPADKRSAVVFDADRALVKWNNQNPDDTYYPMTPHPRKADGSYMNDHEYHDFLVLSGTIARKVLEAETINADAPSKADIDLIAQALRDARRMARENPDGDPARIAPKLVERHKQAKLRTLARLPANIRVTAKLAKENGFKTLPAYRKHKQAELRKEKEEAARWLKARGMTLKEAMKLYEAPKNPKTARLNRIAIRRAFENAGTTPRRGAGE